jgi:hypothetical protein
MLAFKNLSRKKNYWRQPMGFAGKASPLLAHFEAKLRNESSHCRAKEFKSITLL